MGVIGELLVLFLFGSFSFFGSFKCFKASIDEHVVPAKHFLNIVCIDAFVIKFRENSSEVFADLGFVTQCFYVNFLAFVFLFDLFKYISQCNFFVISIDCDITQ